MNGPLLVHMLAAAGVWIVEATVLLGVAWLITRLLHKSAALRHLTWLTTFGLLVLVPLLNVCLPAVIVVRASAPTAVRTLEESLLSHRLVRAVVRRLPQIPQERRFRSPDKLPARYLPIEAGSRRPYRTLALTILLWGWGAGVAIVATQGLVALYGINRLHCRSSANPFDALNQDELGARVGLKRSWELRISDTATPPGAMTWGTRHPIVLLPRDAVHWPAARLLAVLLHELAHVRRCDSLWNLLALVVCALYWFHPAVWMATRAMRAEAELAADDRVLLAGIKPSAYATELLGLAAQLGGQHQPFARLGVALMKESKIETRIRSLVDASRHRHAIRPEEAGKAGAVAIVSILLLVTVRPALSFVHEGREPLVQWHTPRRLSRLRKALSEDVLPNAVRRNISQHVLRSPDLAPGR